MSVQKELPLSLPRVLIVDDEQNILNALRRDLRREDLDIICLSSPEEALRMLSAKMHDVLISDQIMPTMNGLRLLELAREISPTTIRIILTGHADEKAAVAAINRGNVFRFLTKPWDADELCATVRQAVVQHQIVAENKRLLELTSRQNEELRKLNGDLEAKVVERTFEIVRLNEELERRFMGSVRLLAEMAEMRSVVVGRHSKRVAALAKDLSRGFALTEKEIHQIEIAALLHDVGLINVPDEIVRKPEGALTPLEREIIQRHATQGEAIVRMVPDLGEIPKFIRHHHEYFDGTGYPDHLKGKDIPLASRIIAVANAYDNVLNRKTSFQGNTPQFALEFLQRHSPSYFDPEIVSELARAFRQDERLVADEREVEIRLQDLQEGMILSRDIHTSKSLLLLQKNSLLKQEHIDHLKSYFETTPTIEGIYVFRRLKQS